MAALDPLSDQSNDIAGCNAGCCQPAVQEQTLEAQQAILVDNVSDEEQHDYSGYTEEEIPAIKTVATKDYAKSCCASQDATCGIETAVE
jgi:hypothetical protein